MNVDRIANIAGAIVGVAAITTIVSHPASAQVISSIGSSFSEAIRAAMGK